MDSFVTYDQNESDGGPGRRFYTCQRSALPPSTTPRRWGTPNQRHARMHPRMSARTLMHAPPSPSVDCGTERHEAARVRGARGSARACKQLLFLNYSRIFKNHSKSSQRYTRFQISQDPAPAIHSKTKRAALSTGSSLAWQHSAKRTASSTGESPRLPTRSWRQIRIEAHSMI